MEREKGAKSLTTASPGALRTLGNLELDLLTLGEVKPSPGWRSNERLLPVLLFDEPVALGVAEPFTLPVLPIVDLPPSATGEPHGRKSARL
jgi:hypothetical protein